MTERGYRVIYEPLTEAGFQVIVPALPGIVTYGRTLEEAREMAPDAIECHLQGLIKDNEEMVVSESCVADSPIKIFRVLSDL